jgi:hypothetical protein
MASPFSAAFAYPNGRNAVILAAAPEGRYRALVSPAIIASSRGYCFDFAWADERVQGTIRIVGQVGSVIAPRTALKVAPDPDDDRILALSGGRRIPKRRLTLPYFGCNADLIVSNDHHLLNLTSGALSACASVSALSLI